MALGAKNGGIWAAHTCIPSMSKYLSQVPLKQNIPMEFWNYSLIYIHRKEKMYLNTIDYL